MQVQASDRHVCLNAMLGHALSMMSSVQMLEHDERIDIASRWMVERFGNNANDGEPKLPPDAHSAFVCGNNQIELHGAEACCQRNVLRLPAHGGGDTQPTCSRADDIA